MKNLIIVESPAKAKTIEKYLGGDYKVQATIGHIIDLPKNKIAVDVDNGFEPEFVVMPDKKKVITSLKKVVKDSDQVFLATDPDREGEAIAYHVASALNLKNPKRISFHEITKDAVKSAIEKPGEIDQNLVKAQFARRVIDRLVGYKLSQLLWKKIWYGLSAGRVQSVALRLIVEREREIQAFIPEEYWEIFADLLGKEERKKKIRVQLKTVDGKKAKVVDDKQASSIKEAVDGRDFLVKSIAKKDVSKHAYPPFTTSTLQQAANNLLGYSSARTMKVAQTLYQAGYITYMRTDSVNLSSQAIDAIRDYVAQKYGANFLPLKPNYYKNKARNAQEAHEAIRPSHFDVSAEKIKTEMGSDCGKLYDLIFRRAVASQMADKKSKMITANLEVIGSDKLSYVFGVGGEEIVFEGFRKIWKSEAGESEFGLIDSLKEGEVFVPNKIDTVQNFTKPKPRYTEASLVKALEAHGVGRPSTYATIISTIITRGYVKKEQKNLLPSEIGFVVTSFLEKNFTRLVDYEYTADVESRLDDIAVAKVEYKPFMKHEYDPFVKELEKAEGIKKEDVVILGTSEEKCPDCNSEMVIRIGKYGKFLSCSKFPECKGMKSLDSQSSLRDSDKKEVVFDENKYLPAEKCPRCGKNMALKNGRYGSFWTCEDYPKCKGVASLLLKDKCPECGKALVEKKSRWGRTFIGCSGYPDCRFIQGAKKRRFAKSKATSKARSIKSKATSKANRAKSNARSDATSAKPRESVKVNSVKSRVPGKTKSKKNSSKPTKRSNVAKAKAKK